MMKPLETWKNQHGCIPTQTQHTQPNHQISTNEVILESTCDNSFFEKPPDETYITAGQHTDELSSGENMV